MTDQWTPPHSIEAEQAVIGGLLIDSDAINDVADVVRVDDFYLRYNRVIYGAALRVDEAGERVDLMTVIESLRSAGQMEDAGGTEYLGRLARDTPSAANIRAYAEIVRDRSVERQLIQAGMEFQRIVNQPGPVGRKLDQAQQAVLDIGREQGGGPAMVKTHLPAWTQAVDERNRLGGQLTGLSTTLADLDHRTGGLHGGDLIVLAGRPSMGKSALAMQIAAGAADEGRPALVFSMEMSASQLIDRLVSARGRVPMQRIRSGKLEDADWPKLTEASAVVAQWPLLIDESGSLTATDVRARARRVKQKHGLGLVVVDYLQLMDGPGNNRQEQISDISRSLKRLAKDLDVPVLALSQLNRGLENRPNKRPHMADLRESGAIEQDADVIVFVYRDEVYNPDTPDRGVAELIIGKQRQGEVGTAMTLFFGHESRFVNLARDTYWDNRRENQQPDNRQTMDDL